MLFLYNIFIYSYLALRWLAAPLHRKAKLRTIGLSRQGVLYGSGELDRRGKRVIWMHCASLGEFEQGRPIIESLRKSNQDLYIVVTFFSPSGFELRKDFALADKVLYLPDDTPYNVNRFLDYIKPDLVYFIKYEFWYHYLKEIHARKIQLILVSAVFNRNQIFFKWYGGFFRRILKFYTYIYIQDETSKRLLSEIGIENAEIVGDTRIDRVLSIKNAPFENKVLDVFCCNHKILIVGSSWKQDEVLIEALLQTAVFNKWKLVIAPHEITRSVEVREIFKRHSPTLYAQYNAETESRVLIIDNIGMLSQLYRYGKIAYIGGGFGKNIHNTLEPAVYGLPIIFGPKYEKFSEAIYMVEKGGAFSVKDAGELTDIFDRLQNDDFYSLASEVNIGFCEMGKGATGRVLNYEF